jgi:hypothetical protein
LPYEFGLVGHYPFFIGHWLRTYPETVGGYPHARQTQRMGMRCYGVCGADCSNSALPTAEAHIALNLRIAWGFVLYFAKTAEPLCPFTVSVSLRY